MNTTHTALVAAVSCAVLWAADDLTIALSGGLDTSFLDGPLFLLGLVAGLIATVASGLALLGRPTLPARVLGVVCAIVIVALAGALTQLVVGAVQPAHPGWAWGEVNLWVTAVVILALAWRVRSRSAGGVHRSAAAVAPR